MMLIRSSKTKLHTQIIGRSIQEWIEGRMHPPPYPPDPDPNGGLSFRTWPWQCIDHHHHPAAVAAAASAAIQWNHPATKRNVRLARDPRFCSSRTTARVNFLQMTELQRETITTKVVLSVVLGFIYMTRKRRHESRLLHLHSSWIMRPVVLPHCPLTFPKYLPCKFSFIRFDIPQHGPFCCIWPWVHSFWRLVMKGNMEMSECWHSAPHFQSGYLPWICSCPAKSKRQQ
mmetsp:Transcript_14522/g.26346  ORF Transcript_14522/g.26346 Transcript_14522/m.26346 type:complete len:229 (+) Transcript_14522:331-1017(+)